MTDNYTVVGAGGTGTHIIPPLLAYLQAKYGNNSPERWRVNVLDGDTVEKKNFERQLFPTGTQSMNKAEAALMPYSHMYNVTPIDQYLSPANIGWYIQDGAVVLICVDNYAVRSLIESRCRELNNAVVINGGNERHTGSCQIWVRENGENITPPISFLHPEINSESVNRSELSCAEIAALPGGEQLIITNMTSAMWMLKALMDYHNKEIKYHELQFDLLEGKSYPIDYRDIDGWQ